MNYDFEIPFFPGLIIIIELYCGYKYTLTLYDLSHLGSETIITTRAWSCLISCARDQVPSLKVKGRGFDSRRRHAFSF